MDGLYSLISSIKFDKENIVPHLLPAIFLSISLPFIAATFYYAIISVEIGSSSSARNPPWYLAYSNLYIAYVLSSSYSIYRLSRSTIKHIIDSGLTSYYWLKTREDPDTLKTLYSSGGFRKNLPSPVTSLLITLFTGGLAYPVLLYVFEKNIRDHCRVEEEKFLGKAFSSSIDVSTGILDIAATILTMGVFMIYWIHRLWKTYNRHIKLIHGNHPNPPSINIVVDVESLPETPILAFGIGLFGAGLYGLISLYGLPCYYPSILGYGLILAFFSTSSLKEPMLLHIIKSYISIYIVFIFTTIIGFVGAPTYYEYGEYISSIQRSVPKGLWNLTWYIFSNNLLISLLSIQPLYGPLYMGIGSGNAGLIYGVIIALKPELRAASLILPFMPHTLLEFLAYAFFITLSARIVKGKVDEILVLIIMGILVLFLAAYVEAFSILLSRQFT